jgi:hypothetical protein
MAISFLFGHHRGYPRSCWRSCWCERHKCYPPLNSTWVTEKHGFRGESSVTFLAINLRSRPDIGAFYLGRMKLNQNWMGEVPLLLYSPYSFSLQFMIRASLRCIGVWCTLTLSFYGGCTEGLHSYEVGNIHQRITGNGSAQKDYIAMRSETSTRELLAMVRLSHSAEFLGLRSRVSKST